MPKKNYNSNGSNLNKRNPFRAVVRFQGIEYYLGGFPTKEQALAAEEHFRTKRKRTYNPNLARRQT